MNREILFRAKKKYNGEWVEGYYCKTTIGNDVRPSDVIFVPFKVSRNEEWGWMKVDPNTLCQYTGLNDNTKWEDLTESEKELFLSNWNYQEDRKNKVEDWKGKKIWENDIVEIAGEDGYFKCEWEEDTSRFILNGDGLTVDFDNYYGYECEVIGNVFDNADLLEVE